MDLPLAERLIHLGLLVTAGLSIVLLAMLLLERASTGSRRILSWWHVAGATGAFFVVFVAERLYHAL